MGQAAKPKCPLLPFLLRKPWLCHGLISPTRMHDNYYQTKEFEQLLDKYEVAMQHGDSVYFEPDDLTDIAEFYHLHGQTQKARAACDYALNIFPGATAPTVFKARAAMVIDDNPAEARRILATANDKTDLEYYYMEAELLLYENKSDEASAYLQDIFQQLDDEDDRADFVLDVATLYADYQRFEEAQHWLSLSDESDEPDYRELRARIAVSKGDIDEAETILNDLIDEDPYDGRYWNHLASAHLNGGRMHDAIDATDFSIAINPNDQEAIYTKAYALFVLNKYEEAIDNFNHYCALGPSDPNGWYYLGMSYLNIERFDEALESFRKARQLSNINDDILFQIYQEQAFILAHQGQLEEAEQNIAEALKLATTGQQQQELAVLHGHVLLVCGHLLKAHQYFLKAIVDSNQSPHAYLRIAISVYDCGYMRLAYKLFKLLFSQTGEEWADGYAYMALCCYDLALHGEYMHYLEKACTLNPNEAALVLFELFPDNMPVDDYVEYARQSIAG